MVGLLVRVIVVEPVLVRVTVCIADAVPMAVEGKVRLVGEALIDVVAATPVPWSATVCGELAALSAKLIAADSVPVAAGLNVTVTAQEALAASVVPQVLV
jgi:hypothetical protein